MKDTMQPLSIEIHMQASDGSKMRSTIHTGSISEQKLGNTFYNSSDEDHRYNIVKSLDLSCSILSSILWFLSPCTTRKATAWISTLPTDSILFH